MHATLSPALGPLSSPPMRAGTPPSVMADRIIRARKGNPPQIIFSELSPEEISATIDSLVEANGLTDAFLLNAIDNRTKRLNLSSCYHIRKYTLGMIPQQCTSLETIDLSNCRQADNRMVSNLLTNCPKLLSLILDGCVRITDAAFFPSFEAPISLDRLTHLSLAGCRQISEEALLRMASLCSNLIHLSLAGCRTSITASVLAAFLDSCPSLQYLDVSDSLVLSSDTAFVEYQAKFDLNPTPTNFLQINCFKLAGLSGLPPKYTHKTVRAIAHMCGPNLVELDTSWCANITDETCFALSKNCQNLKKISMCNSQTTASGIEFLVTHLPYLESLDLSWCLKVNSNAVSEIVRNAKSLSQLNISHCVDFVSGSSDPSTGGPIGPNDIIALASSHIGMKLTRLELNGLTKIVTPKTIEAIANNCFNLKHLSASLGAETTPTELATAFEIFARNCESISDLSLDISRLTFSPKSFLDTGLRFPNFPNLIRLVVIASPKHPIGDSTVEAILVNRIGLEHLELRNANDVSSNLFQDWIQGYNPDREASLVVGAMIDSELQKGYMSSGGGTTVVNYRNSDSEAAAPTVIFRGRFFSSSRKRNKTALFNPLSSASEAETISLAAGFELLKNSLILSDAARSMDCLKSFTLTGVSKLSDASIDRLSLMMTYMQNLEILDAQNLTENCAENLKRRCKLLRSMELSGAKIRVRIDTSRVYNRRHRRKGAMPPQAAIAAAAAAMKRKLTDDELDDGFD